MDEKDDRLRFFEANSPLFKGSFNIIILIVLLLLLGMLFIPFPQQVKREALAEYRAASLPLVAETKGVLRDFHQSGEIQKDTFLYLLEDDIDVSEIDSALFYLRALQSGSLQIIPRTFDLGPFQKEWNELIGLSKTISLDESEKRYLVLSTQLRNELNVEKRIHAELIVYLSLATEELAIVEKRYQENNKLFEAGGISRQEIALWEKNVLETEQKISSLNNQILEVGKLEQGLEDQLRAAQKDVELTKGLNVIRFEQQVNNLIWSLSSHRDELNPRADRSGKLVWSSDLKSEQSIVEGDVLGIIYPVDSPIELVFTIAPKDKRRIKSGNKVKVFFEDYPRMQYGYVETAVKEIPLNIEKGGYQFRVPVTLLSSKGKQLDILPGMRSVVKVNCGSRSIFSLFLDKFNY